MASLHQWIRRAFLEVAITHFFRRKIPVNHDLFLPLPFLFYHAG
jgi:hypothetical protein